MTHRPSSGVRHLAYATKRLDLPDQHRDVFLHSLAESALVDPAGDPRTVGLLELLTAQNQAPSRGLLREETDVLRGLDRLGHAVRTRRNDIAGPDVKAPEDLRQLPAAERCVSRSVMATHRREQDAHRERRDRRGPGPPRHLLLAVGPPLGTRGELDAATLAAHGCTRSSEVADSRRSGTISVHVAELGSTDVIGMGMHS